MSLNKKILLFALLLFIPIAAVLFLESFGKNRYKLPVYYAEDSIIGEGGQYEITQARQVPDFRLVNEDGKEINQSLLRGYIHVADFFFTRCPDVCPKMTTQLTRVQEEFEKDSLVKIISFTIDPKYDSAAILKSYAQMYNAIPGKWTFATGTKDSIHALAQTGYYITAMGKSDNVSDYDHSNKLVLVDKNGWIRGYYNGTDQKEVDKLIMEIKVLEEIYANESTDK